MLWDQGKVQCDKLAKKKTKQNERKEPRIAEKQVTASQIIWQQHSLAVKTRSSDPILGLVNPDLGHSSC